MNTLNIFLSSSEISGVNVLPEIELEDRTTVTVNLTGISEEIFPVYLKIDWGDGVTEKHDSNLYKKYREESIFEEVLLGKYSSIFRYQRQHTYNPPNSTLFTNLTAQFLIRYSNVNYSWFIQPFKIRSYDYYESLGDIKLINSIILDREDNSAEHQIISKGGHLVELIT
jgi:hypothetical protein